MALGNWIHFSSGEWWIWTAVAGVFCAYLVWVRATRPRRSFIPLVFVTAWLAGSVAYYLATHWQHYFARTALWLSGVASILVVAAVPLALSVALERVTRLLIARHMLRGFVAGATAVLVTLFIQLPLALWVQRIVLHVIG